MRIPVVTHVIALSNAMLHVCTVDCVSEFCFFCYIAGVVQVLQIVAVPVVGTKGWCAFFRGSVANQFTFKSSSASS